MTTRDSVTIPGRANLSRPLDPVDERYEISVLTLVNTLLRQRRLIARITLALVIVVGALSLSSKRTYTATTSITTQTGRSSAGSSLLGLAAQFGVSIPTGDAAQSPAYYAQILKSRQIFAAVARADVPYPAGESATHGPLQNLVAGATADTARRLSQTLIWLGQHVHTDVEARTGIITIGATATSPALVYAIVNHMLAELARFNLRVRESQAGAERAFTGRRLEEAKDSLRLAQANLQDFMQHNRNFRSSPELSFTYDRLQAEVGFRQTLTTSLAQAYEQAKIEEVRDTPVFTVTDPPMMPVDGDPRGTVMKLVMALLGGLVLGSIVALIRNFNADRVNEFDESVEFQRLRRETFSDMIRPWRIFGRSTNGLARQP